MRVLVLYAHPLPDSFAAALHRTVVAALQRGGHQVDDCDLYAEGFDPVLTAAERAVYNAKYPDLSAVARLSRERFEDQDVERALDEIGWAHVRVEGRDTKMIYNDASIIYNRM